MKRILIILIAGVALTGCASSGTNMTVIPAPSSTSTPLAVVIVPNPNPK